MNKNPSKQRGTSASLHIVIRPNNTMVLADKVASVVSLAFFMAVAMVILQVSNSHDISAG